jgi:hypothetical protein
MTRRIAIHGILNEAMWFPSAGRMKRLNVALLPTQERF